MPDEAVRDDHGGSPRTASLGLIIPDYCHSLFLTAIKKEI